MAAALNTPIVGQSCMRQFTPAINNGKPQQFLAVP
jgi:hypothetical protein